MSKLVKIALGIFTSIGGFLEVGAIATTAQAGSAFGFSLIWTIVVGTICVIFLVEMSGRLAAVSHHTIKDALRERFGPRIYMVTLVSDVLINFLVLAAEIGGMSLALQLVTGISFRWWAVPTGILTWLLLWKGSFGLIENGVSLLGMVAVAFLVAAWKLHPPLDQVLAGAVPQFPTQRPVHYWFTAVSILGAAISPYLFYFYSAGAIEDHWDEDSVGVNRAVATVGMSFGGVLATAVLVVAAVVFYPRGIEPERFEQVALILTEPLGRAGFYFFAATLFVSCLGAALELGLATAYCFANGLGWNWGENVRPRDAARFTLSYTVLIALASLLMLTGIDPLQLTLFSMALTSLTLPIVTFPFLVLMNDRDYVGEHGNHWVGNLAVIVISLLASVLALVAIPLQLMGG
ncbi:MAG TPA: Nramp family divalent metal transporter [Gemmatimonadales bacterium]|nr:Nramp family divalent metal transporter [Gemmatimonadales bacterium]